MVIFLLTYALIGSLLCLFLRVPDISNIAKVILFWPCLITLIVFLLLKDFQSRKERPKINISFTPSLSLFLC